MRERMISAHAAQLLEGMQGTALGAEMQWGSLQRICFQEPTLGGLSLISHHKLLREVL